MGPPTTAVPGLFWGNRHPGLPLRGGLGAPGLGWGSGGPGAPRRRAELCQPMADLSGPAKSVKVRPGTRAGSCLQMFNECSGNGQALCHGTGAPTRLVGGTRCVRRAAEGQGAVVPGR